MDQPIQFRSRAAPVLAHDEPPAFEAVNRDGRAPFLLICDHASRRVPRALGNLGLEEAVLMRHIGWDIGAADVARRLSEHFDASLILAGYSRLVIDCNRALEDASSIPEESDGVPIPGNRGLAAAGATERADALFRPYHREIEEALLRCTSRGLVPALVSIHSFTPIIGGVERPWHIGILWDEDPRIALPLIAELRKPPIPVGGREPELVVGDNQPYSAREPKGYSVATHAASKGFPHVAIEIRQDLIDTHHGAAEMAARLAKALAPVLGDGGLYRAI